MNEYFGTLQKNVRSRNVVVREYRYPESYVIGHHLHEAAYLSVVLHGAYREISGSVQDEVDGPTVILHRPGESHRNVFGSSEATILSIDMPGDWFSAFMGVRCLYKGVEVTAAIRRLSRELEGKDPATEWFVESAVLHLVGILIRKRQRRHRDARWLHELTAYLQDNYSRNPPLQQLAALAQVHPVHLARYFKTRYGCTVGEYVRSIRIDRALKDITGSNKPIAHIALQHGFSDQSHLTRQVKRHTGLSPTKLRTMVQS